VIDGIIPMTHENVNLRGLASYISSAEIAAFLKAIEDEQIEPLVGGHAARHVGSDQDPEKMDIEKVIGKFS
jgi:hypothetical protein